MNLKLQLFNLLNLINDSYPNGSKQSLKMTENGHFSFFLTVGKKQNNVVTDKIPVELDLWTFIYNKAMSQVQF